MGRALLSQKILGKEDEAVVLIYCYGTFSASNLTYLQKYGRHIANDDCISKK